MSFPAVTTKIPATIITGFLGAGKTTLVRHIIAYAGGRRLAIIVNEFGTLGIDGDILKGCGNENCTEDDIVELSNGCLCCTVADDFLPTIEALINRPNPPEHILIETSGLALPKPLLKAFDWPAIRSRVTVDGVIAVVDGPAIATGRFADDPEEVARQRALDPSLDHDNPLAEVYEDQIRAADLVILNKTDLLEPAEIERLKAEIANAIPRAVKIVTAYEGKISPDVLLGLAASAEDDLAARPSHHDAVDGAHEHDDFESFIVALPASSSPQAIVERLREAAEAHGILRMKGYVSIEGKPMRLMIQGVGARFRHYYDRPWAPDEARDGHLVVIGQTGLDRAAVEKNVSGRIIPEKQPESQPESQDA
ncbi:MAG: cobalamin biosynthesis protein CobW [Parvibaculaceae bacterium]|nr:cobalamin biosynthesis protein CobW [Parvibaculaceae bacterium]